MKHELLNGYNLDLLSQTRVLEKIVMSSKIVQEAIECAVLLDLDNYYIGAGSIAQTVWNYLSNNPLDYGIKDVDFVYYDDKSIDLESESTVTSKVLDIYSDLNIKVDVKNQARVHIWYKNHFGYDIEPYTSIESAINTWPTTATAIGVRKERNNDFRVYAPFGLNDLFGKIVRPNKRQITKGIYEKKVESWLTKWPDLKIVSWEE